KIRRSTAANGNFVSHCRQLCAAQRIVGENTIYTHAFLLAELMG
ncbi:MAG: hypothetical protein ACI901_001397, partial [Octadecabacter sp.]